MKISFDKNGFKINGEDAFMVSGEFHYFRVPRSDWKRRMELFREAGGNTIATYVPWIVHEPTEGNILFGDRDERDLAAFLDTARETGLAVVLRPGPYQYSELINDGLPEWLLSDYPEILAKNPDGTAFRHASVSYLHPVFLEKARCYYKAFADVVRPYLNDPVTMLQVDNEAMGVHFWFGGIDYNPETMGFHKADGRYPRYLMREYGDIAALNKAYGTDYKSFTDLGAPMGLSRNDPNHCRVLRDYYNFYYETISEYLVLLRDWLYEDGLKLPACHNAASMQWAQLFKKTVEDMGDNFLLGSDHYYQLNQNWGQNNPTPQHFIKCIVSMERLRLLGMPPSVLEMPGGSPSDTPPMLYEDLLAWYRAHIAFGMKGVNYYVYTGGPNFTGTGATNDIYDYNALVHADGTLNDTYIAAKDIGLFMKSNPWLQHAVRRTSVNVGFEWEFSYAKDFDLQDVSLDAMTLRTFIEKGIMHTLLSTKYSPALCALDDDIPADKPLIVPTASVMSEAAQKKLCDYVSSGGGLIMLGALPKLNEKYESCTILRDFIGDIRTGKGYSSDRPVRMSNGRNVYQLSRVESIERLPDGVEIIAADTANGNPVGIRKVCGGTLIWMGVKWDMGLFSQAEMVEDLLMCAGAKPTVESSNRNIMTSLLESDGRRMLFLLNLYTGRQKTDITVFDGDKATKLGAFELGAMEVIYMEI